MEEDKVIQEVAKATGKAIDAAREAGGFIAKFISGPLEHGMGIFGTVQDTCAGSAKCGSCSEHKTSFS